ncbi:adhesin [Catenuloplanes atrovinosus]|uniref:Fe-S cluster assembly iron-binding protein IscA n=1 Tax=Catenuloplanes atrovinosus TaxID=137266 RepID=A0AAE4C9A7_9ACTN|nr:adhesin [Catenuloplanes atrovinosus]MDR7274619.1 Fe-S cluster assembly iron-binding protein IscA [Catenuloplanes atrovinosus]
MFMVTGNAAEVIRRLAERERAPAGAGLRIAADPRAGELTVGLSPRPSQGDTVLQAGGAYLFLCPVALRALDDKALDATMTEDGEFDFIMAEQPR